MYRWEEHNLDDEMKFFEHGPKFGQGRCAVLGAARVGTYWCDSDRLMIFLCVVLKVVT